MIVMTETATLQIVMAGKKIEKTLMVDPLMTIEQALDNVEEYKALRTKLFDSKDDPQKYLSIMLNGKSIDYSNGMSTVIKANDSLNILPKVSGGSF